MSGPQDDLTEDEQLAMAKIIRPEQWRPVTDTDGACLYSLPDDLARWVRKQLTRLRTRR